MTGCLALGVGCGSEIGDSCQFSSECSAAGDRICAAGEGLPGGYCTVFGCDYDTCPDEAVCVRFFSLGSTNITCDATTEDRSTDDCSPDEFCTIGGSCVPRSAEIRYCMKKCDGDGDCRENYHCRTGELMVQFGGEPILAPGDVPRPSDAQAFCATAP